MLPMGRFIHQDDIIAEFIAGHFGAHLTSFGVIAGGQGTVKSGTVLQLGDDLKLHRATGQDKRVMGVALDHVDTAAGDAPNSVLVSRLAEVVKEKLILPEPTTEGSSVIAGMPEDIFTLLMLELRLGFTIRSASDPSYNYLPAEWRPINLYFPRLQWWQ